MDGAWCGFIPSPNQLWPLCWKRGINNSGLGFTKVRVWSQWPAYTKNFKVEFPSLFWPWKPSSAGRTGLCSIHVGSGQFSYTPISSWHNLPTSLKPQIKLWGIKVKFKHLYLMWGAVVSLCNIQTIIMLLSSPLQHLSGYRLLLWRNIQHILHKFIKYWIEY